MSHPIYLLVTLTSALGCGLIAGVFFAFSTFIMRALALLPPVQGIAAMQSINIVVLNPWFLGVFLGTGILCAGTSIFSLISWSRPAAAWVLVGSVLYIVGTIIVTMAFNVPRNNALAVVNPASPAGAALWADYLVTWTAWNHVRTAAALAAAACLTIGLWLAKR